MQLLTNLLASIDLGGIALNIVSFTVVLGVLVFIHELGHFAVAKWCGVRVHEFALGFGPALLRKRFGETVYSFRLLPLGGFVKMAGMEPTETLDEEVPAEEDDERAFHRKPVWQRMAIIAAGPVMNLFLAVVLHAIVISMLVVSVGSVMPGSPAEEGGLQPGDRFVSVAGQRVITMEQVLTGIQQSDGNPVRIVVERDGSYRTVVVYPRVAEAQGVPTIGIEMVMGIGQDRRPAGESLILGARQTWIHIGALIESLGRMVTGQEKANLAGPIGIFQMTGEFVESGMAALLSFVAALSISLGVLNLLPIPILDGGGLLLLVIEAVRGKPLSPETRGMAQLVGLSLLLLIFLYATFQDISRLGSGNYELSMTPPDIGVESPLSDSLERAYAGGWRVS